MRQRLRSVTDDQIDDQVWVAVRIVAALMGAAAFPALERTEQRRLRSRDCAAKVERQGEIPIALRARWSCRPCTVIGVPGSCDNRGHVYGDRRRESGHCGRLLTASASTRAALPSGPAVQALLQQLVDNHGIKGIVVGLLDGAGARRVFAHGNPGCNDLPLDGESVFEIGSMTKVFTGILLADMVRRGDVELADPVADLLLSGVRVPARNGKMITLLSTCSILPCHCDRPAGPTLFAKSLSPIWEPTVVTEKSAR